MTKDEEILRTLLAVNYAGASLYRDDGELQDNTRLPFIDFMRDSVDEIRKKMTERNITVLVEWLENNQE